MVPVPSIIFMTISCLAVFGFAVGLAVFLKKKKGADLLPFFVGAAVMFLFAFVLENLVHSVVLTNTSTGSNLLLYSIYGGLMAGLFEETGRLIAFKTVLKKKLDKKANALMYGAGHGCFEAIWILGIAMINNLIWSILINSGNTALLYSSVTEGMEAQISLTIATLISSSPFVFLAGLIERSFAIVIQISLSVFVWYAVREKRIGYYFCALALHAVIDFLTAFVSGSGVSIILVELLIGVLALISALSAGKIYTKVIE